MKTCNYCGIEKSLSEFYKNSRRVYPYCKLCAKQKYAKTHYNNNKDRYKASAKHRSELLKAEYVELKKTLKCEICGEKRSHCLAFHHPDPGGKDRNVSELVGNGSRTRLFEEIAKCVVLCHNCHADEHYKLNTGEGKW